MSKRNEIYYLLNEFSSNKISLADAYTKLQEIYFKYEPISIGSLDKDIVDICVEAYNNGETITAITTLIEEYKVKNYKFGIKEAKEYLEQYSK